MTEKNYFGAVTQDDVENFIATQKEVHGDTFTIPNLADRVDASVTKPATSAFSTYREALGAAQTLQLSDGSSVTVGKPKVKSIKYLLSNIDKIQKKAESDNPIESLAEFEKIMLDCLIFPEGSEAKSVDRQGWFDDLAADDGLLIAETFTKVFDIKYLLARSAGADGKK